MIVNTPCLGDAELSGFLDGQLSPDQEAVVSAHLETCHACTAALQRLASTWSLADVALAVGSEPSGNAAAALQKRLLASPPELTALPAEPPPEPPTIPGCTDLELVSCGGMGVVYRGFEVSLGRRVAIKVFAQHTGLSQFARLRAEREAKMLAQLDHPAIVTIHRAGTIGGVPYLVMEWIDGPTLQQQIDDGTLPPQQAAVIARDLARGIAEVHAVGIIHRDLKPVNVLLSRPGSGVGESRAKLIDFGLARPEDVDEQLTRDGTVLGTPGFMAAEQTGLEPERFTVGLATDVHGIGGLLFAMVTGKAPYTAATPLESMQRAVRGEVTQPELLRDLPLDLATITLKCLDASPTLRYRSAGELADDLDRFLDGQPVYARPVTAVVKAAKWARRRPGLAAVLAVSLLLFGLLITGGIYHVAAVERANREISHRAAQVQAASIRASETAAKLTGSSIRRLLRRGQALDAGDRAFLLEIRNTYQQWPLEPDRLATLRLRAGGLRDVAAMFLDTSNFTDAAETFRAERSAWEAVEQLTPNDPAAVEHQLAALRQESYCLSRLQRTDAAIALSQIALQRYEDAPRKTTTLTQELVLAQIRLASFLAEQDRHNESQPLAAAAIAEIDRQQKDHPDDQELATTALIVLHNAALIAEHAGKPAEQADRWRQLIQLARNASKQFPQNAVDFVKAESRGLASLATLAGQQQGWEAAVPLVTERWQLCDRHHRQDQSAPALQRELIKAALQEYHIHSQLGRVTDAGDMLDRARPVAEAIVAGHPTLFDNASLLASLLHAQAHCFQARGQTQRAVTALMREIELLRPWQKAVGHGEEVVQRLNAARKLQNSLARTAG